MRYDASKRPVVLNPRPLCCVFATLFLAACSTETGGGATFESARFVADRIVGKSAEPSLVFNPAYRYMRVTQGDSVAYLVLGYVDPLQEGPVEVWYSAKREVVRLAQGRILGTTGLTSDWRRVRAEDVPSWDTLLRGPGEARYRRWRDVMPGYHFNIDDRVHVVRLSSYAPVALRGRPAATLTWFEERDDTLSAGADPLPPARFGVARDEDGLVSVVYSEQCLSADVCYTFERWKAPSTTAPSAAAGS